MLRSRGLTPGWGPGRSRYKSCHGKGPSLLTEMSSFTGENCKQTQLSYYGTKDVRFQPFTHFSYFGHCPLYFKIDLHMTGVLNTLTAKGIMTGAG